MGKVIRSEEKQVDFFSFSFFFSFLFLWFVLNEVYAICDLKLWTKFKDEQAYEVCSNNSELLF